MAGAFVRSAAGWLISLRRPDNRPKQESSLTGAMYLYMQATGKEGNQRFIASPERSVTEVVFLSGDKAMSAYNRSDALKFRDVLVSRG